MHYKPIGGLVLSGSDEGAYSTPLDLIAGLYGEVRPPAESRREGVVGGQKWERRERGGTRKGEGK